MADILPDKLTAGLTFDRLVTLTAYPAPDWSLTVLLRGPGSIDIDATADGSQHLLHKTAAETGAMPPGLYRYSARVTDGVDVVEVEAGTTSIEADLASVAGGDMRSHARIVLDNINAVIEKRATQDQQRYTINNRELWRTPIHDLLALKNQYQALVSAEDAKAKGSNIFGRQVRMRLR